MTLRVFRDVKLMGAWRLCLGSGHWWGVKREKGGHVATGFLHRECCSLRYSVIMLSNAGGEGKCLSNCFFIAGLWLKAPWSDFCLSTRGFLQLAALHPICRSREKTIRPICEELWLQFWTDVEGNTEDDVEGCDVDGRVCALLDPGEDEWEGWFPSLALTPLASRGVRGKVATGGAGRGGATEGKVEGECEEWDRHAIGSSASLVSVVAVSWRPLATRWFLMSNSSSFSGKVIFDWATTLALCSHARDTSVPISSGFPEILSMSSAANLQNLTCSLRLSWRTGSFMSCWMCPLLNSGSLLMICLTVLERERPTRALQARARIWSASVMGIFTVSRDSSTYRTDTEFRSKKKNKVKEK